MESLKLYYHPTSQTGLIREDKLSQLIVMELRFTLEMLFVKSVVSKEVEKSHIFTEIIFSSSTAKFSKMLECSLSEAVTWWYILQKALDRLIRLTSQNSILLSETLLILVDQCHHRRKTKVGTGWRVEM